MTLKLALSFLTAILLGYAFLVIALPVALRRLPIALSLGLASGIGMGATSCLFFLWKVAGGNRATVYIIVEIVILVLAAFIAVFRFARCRKPGAPHEPLAPRSPWPAVVFLLLLIAALIAFVCQCLQQPHGEWDAWAIWNRHARFMFRGGEHWKDCFTPELHRSHPDYPLLVPSSVARAWMWTGGERVSGPMAVAGLFMAATALSLFGTVLTLRGSGRALTAAAILLGTPFFISLASYQYADGPLAFFILSALALSLLADSRADGRAGYLAMAGAAAAMAAWTKNEGVLFALVFVLCRLAFSLRQAGRSSAFRDLRSILFGLLPVILIVALFKVGYAPPNDLLSPANNPAPLASRVGDPARWKFVFGAMLEGIVVFGDWRLLGNALLGTPIVMAAWLILAGLGKDRPAGTGVAGCSLAIMLLSYMTVYAATPHDLSWHMGTSLTRLLMQLWPSAVMLFCLAAASPLGAESPAAAPAASR